MIKLQNCKSIMEAGPRSYKSYCLYNSDKYWQPCLWVWQHLIKRQHSTFSHSKEINKLSIDSLNLGSGNYHLGKSLLTFQTRSITFRIKPGTSYEFGSATVLEWHLGPSFFNTVWTPDKFILSCFPITGFILK